METNEIKIGIVDDDSLFVQLLQTYINNQPKMKVVEVSESGNAFLAKCLDKEDVDILILDLRMSDGNGLEVLDQMRAWSTQIKIIVLSTFYQKSFIGQILRMGANAFLSKEIDQEELIEVIQSVHNQGHYFSEEQVNVIRKQLSLKTPKFQFPQKNTLTEREIEVLKLVCSQHTTQEIANKLFISPKTVETHKSNLIVKAGVKNTIGLVIFAIQNGIVNANEVVLINW